MVTFLLTDVEGSTRLWEERPADMATALAAHDALVDEVVAGHGGQMIKSRGEGDATFSVFDEAAGAVGAALDAQQSLAGALFRVRIALHTGEAQARDGDYFGPTVNRCARLRSAAHGGQVVLSYVTQQLARDRLPTGASFLDLGVHRLRDLAEPERVFQLCHPALPSDFPPLASLDTRQHNLPSPLTRFVGRRAELGELRETLAGSRLVTLIGPGGSGKTRLALEAARRSVETFPDGVWLVELSRLTNAGQVSLAVAAALGLREEPARPLSETVAKYIEDRTALFVLDNCEHLIDAAAATADQLLRASAASRVLATSRQSLGMAGERVWPVTGLSVPDDASFEASEAITLFVDRAEQVNPRLDVTAVDRTSLTQICRRLDGLPLAIELAAALSDRMSIGDIASRLDERFELLTAGSRTAEPRQRSLSAAIDWSYELLDGAERDGFGAISVFPGDFTLGAGEAVAGRGAVDVLGRLVAKSLLARAGDRYTMLESIRVYAADRLAASGRSGQVRDRHLDWALATVAVGDLDTIDREDANLLAALGWATARRPDDALHLVNGLSETWEVRGYWSEGRRLLDEVLSLGDALDPAARAAALHRAGRFAAAQGDFAVAAARLSEALALAEDTDNDTIVNKALTDLGGVAHMRGDVDEARVHFEAALGIARSMGSTRSEAGALGNLGIIAHATGDLQGARALQGQALDIARTLDDDAFLGDVLLNAGMIAAGSGDAATAETHYSEALALAQRQGNQNEIAKLLTRLADIHAHRGEHDVAEVQLQESIDVFRALGDRPNLANGLYRLGELARQRDAGAAARAMLEESAALWRGMGHVLGEAALQLSLGEMDRVEGYPGAALQRFTAALESLHGLHSREGAALAVDHIAAVVAGGANVELAAELVGAVGAMRERIGVPPVVDDDRPVSPVALRAALGDGPFETAIARGAAVDDDQAVALALAAAAAVTA